MDININDYKKNVKTFKAFCDENRLMILEMLQDGEKCACVLLDKLKIAQSTLSHHMKILVDSGIVIANKNGKWTNYSISKSGVIHAKQLLSDMTQLKCDSGGDGLCK